STVAVDGEEEGKSVLRITITEGKNRQVRRMCEAVGLEVARLKRVSVGPVKLGMLQPGKWRELTALEVGAIRNAISTDPDEPNPNRRHKVHFVDKRSKKN
ncbi:MAG: hypothetical protein RR315_02140, partial [Oscillospiraceae bacterium]